MGNAFLLPHPGLVATCVDANRYVDAAQTGLGRIVALRHLLSLFTP
jgi:hypothetical protein